MKNYLTYLWIIFFAICGLATSINAQTVVERYTNFLQNDQNGLNEIAIGETLVVLDSKMNDDDEWGKIAENVSVRCIINLELDEDIRTKIITRDPPHSIFPDVDMTIDYWTADAYRNNESASHTESLSLRFNYNDNKISRTSTNCAHEIQGYHKAEITISNVFNDANLPLKLSADIVVERRYAFDFDGAMAYPNITSDYNTTITTAETTNPVITWDVYEGADEYDLEWVFFDELSEVGKEVTDNTITYNFNSLFTNNATRVTTSEQFFEIPKLYPKGYILYRLRAAHYNQKGNRITTDWTSSDDPDGFLSTFSDKIFVEWHEPDLNWQAQTSYAEEAKNVPSVQYFDGSLRQRQTVTLSNSEGMSIAEQTIYDYHGRPALAVMAAPTFGNTVDYVSLLSAPSSNSAIPYNKEHFDDTNPVLMNGDPFPRQMSSAVGASSYYSSNNPRIAAGDFHQYVPDAEGYPYTVTEYTPDMTGRVRKQSGVGKAFALDGDHTTTYYYGKAPQEEIDRLFGNEVGFASHYQKNMVKDPNGQVSVSYVDAHGRTIATALAGDTPKNEDDSQDMLQALSSNAGSASLERDILNNIPGTLESHFTLLVSSEGDYSFDYDSGTATYEPDCADPTITPCYDCKYDLSITIINNDNDPNFNAGSPYTETVLSNVGMTDVDNCSDEVALTSIITALMLPIGEYQITKKLTVSQASLNVYLKDFLSKEECLPDYDLLVAQAESEIDDEACSLNDETVPDRCEVSDIVLKVDLSPDGQYGQLAPNNTNSIFDDSREFEEPDQGNPMLEWIPLTSNLYMVAKRLETASALSECQFFHAVNVVNGTDLTQSHDDVMITVNPGDEPISFLTLIQTAWNPEWLNCPSILEMHPEYCRYRWYTQSVHDYASSCAFDEKIRAADSYSKAVAAGFINNSCGGPSSAAENENSKAMNDCPSACITPTVLFKADGTVHDDFFVGGGNCTNRTELRYTMMERMGMLNDTEYCSSVSILELAQSAAYCEGEFPCNIAANCTDCTYSRDLFWEVYKNLYLGLKYQIQSELLAGDREDVDDTFYEFTDCNLTQVCNSPLFNPLVVEIERFPIVLENPVSDATFQSNEDEANMNLIKYCNDVCGNQADAWIAKLEPCLIGVSTTTIEDIRDGLIAVCKSGCDENHPFGASTTSDGNDAPGTPYDSFADVISTLLPNVDLNDCDPNCNAEMIDFPPTYEAGSDFYAGALEPIYRSEVLDDSDMNCMCDQYTALKTDYDNEFMNMTFSGTLQEYLEDLSDAPLTVNTAAILDSYCPSGNNSTSCNVLPSDLRLPPYLQCEVCLTCNQVKADLIDFSCNLPEESRGYSILRAQFLNQIYGFTITPEEYDTFLEETCAMNSMTPASKKILCPSSAFGNYEFPDIETTCEDALNYQARVNAIQAYFAEVEALKQKFTTEYLSDCIYGLTDERFTTTGGINEYHYTLYYYDQAGNLVKTVPPNGVKPLTDLTDLSNVQAHRKEMQVNGSVPDAVYPPHTYLTEYRYNTLNEVVRQDSPDNYTSGMGLSDKEGSEMWYDRVGRAVVSQDGRQRNFTSDPDLYSYTIYDEQGRITQVGELFVPDDDKMTVAIARDQTMLDNWITRNAGTKQFVTYTYYDEVPLDTNGDPLFDLSEVLPEGQENLRPRVASTAKDEDGDGIAEYATHYSYDASGNVKTLIQEIKRLKDIYGSVHGQKRIDYDYDYISGNVHAVYYQKDKKDHFSHRYYYDENNRLIEVKTSPVEGDIEDSPYWKTEAVYDYYLHGPLARMEVGEQRVQATDYFYTLQGWIKGVNSSLLDPDRDIGRDGKTKNDAARDAMSYTLGYYADDYNTIATLAAANSIEASRTESDLEGDISNTPLAPSLYNGNIRLMDVDIMGIDEPVTHQYRYDQLHRIKQMKTAIWSTPYMSVSTANQYQTNYTYDPNGNLTSLKRNDNTGNTIDDLSYNYTINDNGGTPTNNLLEYVSDAAGDKPDVEDVIDQGINNYEYDAAGNLIKNNAEGTTLTWTPYGKVKQIDFNNRQSTYYGYDAAQNRVYEDHPSGSDPTVAFYHQSTYYIRDAQGNILCTYGERHTRRTFEPARYSATLTQENINIFGSSRLGSIKNTSLPIAQLPEGQSTGIELNGPANQPMAVTIGGTRVGQKLYECTNHLGNVLAVINDRREGVDTDGDDIIDYFEPTVNNSSDYYPFGMDMVGRTYRNLYGRGYRFGFNGKEADRDDEWGDLTHYDYGFRIYNPGIGRFLSVDPLTAKYPWYSSYHFAGNNPIKFIDLDGAEIAVKDLFKYSIKNPNGETVKIAIGATNYLVDGAVQSFDIPFYDFDGKITFKWDSERSVYINSSHGTYAEFASNWQEAEGNWMSYKALKAMKGVYSLAEGLIRDSKQTVKDMATEEIEASDLDPVDILSTKRNSKTTRTSNTRGGKWGYNTYAKEGRKSAIDHIYDRHSYHKGTDINSANSSLNKKVGVFRQNLNTKDKIKNLVDEAIKEINSNDWSTPDRDGIKTATYKFDHNIGTSREGASTSTIKIHVDKNGWVQSAYPVKNG